jgi:hypothetical protein
VVADGHHDRQDDPLLDADGDDDGGRDRRDDELVDPLPQDQTHPRDLRVPHGLRDPEGREGNASDNVGPEATPIEWQDPLRHERRTSGFGRGPRSATLTRGGQ